MKKLVLVTLSALGLLLSGCSKNQIDQFIGQFANTFGKNITIAPGDRTPPVVTLVVPYNNSQVTLSATGQPMTFLIHKGDEFYVVAIAEDPEGVKTVGVTTSQFVRCSKDGQAYTSSSGGQQTYTGPGAIGQSGLTRLWLPVLVSGNLVGCGPGETDEGTAYSVSAFGTNFSGGSSTSQAAVFKAAP